MTADVRGTALLDGTTYEMRRLEFQLTRGETLSPPVEGFRVTASYRDLAKGLRILDDVESVQDFVRERPGDPVAKGLESQKLLDVHFLADSFDVVRSTLSAPLPRGTLPDSSKIRQSLRDSVEAVVERTTEVRLRLQRVGEWQCGRCRNDRSHSAGREFAVHVRGCGSILLWTRATATPAS